MKKLFLAFTGSLLLLFVLIGGVMAASELWGEWVAGEACIWSTACVEGHGALIPAYGYTSATFDKNGCAVGSVDFFVKYQDNVGTAVLPGDLFVNGTSIGTYTGGGGGSSYDAFAVQETNVISIANDSAMDDYVWIISLQCTAPEVTPTPIAGDETEYEIEYLSVGCTQAAVQSCSTSGNPYVYANGLQIGECISASMPLTFSCRPQMTNTITLLSDTYFDVYTVSVDCLAALSDPVIITPTVDLTTPEPITLTLGQESVIAGSGFLGIDFGGSLSNPNAPVNKWLGYATDFIGIVNSGNLLYIIGAIATAGAVLSWAIAQVRNPKSW